MSVIELQPFRVIDEHGHLLRKGSADTGDLPSYLHQNKKGFLAMVATYVPS